MKRATIAACCALASVPSFAGDWAQAGMQEDQALLVDSSSIVKTRNIRGAWMLAINRNDFSVGAYSVAWFDFDCKDKKMRGQDFQFYDLSGKVTMSGQLDEGWSRVFPGSTGEVMLNSVCKNDAPVIFRNATPHTAAKVIREVLTKKNIW